MSEQTTYPAQYPTFVTKGLTEVQIKFLIECEKLWLNGDQSDTQMLLKAYSNAGFIKGAPEADPCLKAWRYWNFINKPYLRASAVTPVKLSTLLTLSEHGRTLSIKTDKYQFIKVIETTILLNLNKGLISGDYRFELLDNERLYQQSNLLSVSRYLAKVENDLIIIQ